MRDRKSEKRKEQLLKAIEENPKDRENHLIVAKFYFVNERYPETIEVYKKLLEYYPKDIEILYNLAVAYKASKENENAKNTYLRILKIDPTNNDARDGLVKLTTFK